MYYTEITTILRDFTMTNIDYPSKTTSVRKICPKTTNYLTFLFFLRNRRSLSTKPNGNTNITDFMNEKLTVKMRRKSVF